MKPIAPNPASMSAYVSGSGTAVVNVLDPSTFSSRLPSVAVVGYMSGALNGVPRWKPVVSDVPGGITWLDVKCISPIGPSSPAM